MSTAHNKGTRILYVYNGPYMVTSGMASLTAGDRPAMTAMTAGHDRRGRKYLQSSAVDAVKAVKRS